MWRRRGSVRRSSLSRIKSGLPLMASSHLLNMYIQTKILITNFLRALKICTNLKTYSLYYVKEHNVNSILLLICLLVKLLFVFIINIWKRHPLLLHAQNKYSRKKHHLKLQKAYYCTTALKNILRISVYKLARARRACEMTRLILSHSRVDEKKAAQRQNQRSC